MSAYKVGEVWQIPITLKKEGSIYDASSKVVEAGIFHIKGNSKSTLINFKTLSSSASGADWSNGVVVVELTALETATIDKLNNVFVEIKVTDGADVELWPVREIPVIPAIYVSVPTLPFSDLTDEVLIEIPKASKPLIEMRLLKVITDFCKRTNSWQESCSFNAVAEQLNYTLPANGLAKIFMILEVSVNDTVISKNDYSLNDCDIIFEKNRQPNSGVITVKTSMIPDGMECPDWFLSHYRTGLIYGGVSSLMKMPNRSWTDFNLAEYYEKEYFNILAEELYKQTSHGVSGSGGMSA